MTVVDEAPDLLAKDPPESFVDALNLLDDEQLTWVLWECVCRVDDRVKLLVARNILQHLTDV